MRQDLQAVLARLGREPREGNHVQAARMEKNRREDVHLEDGRETHLSESTREEPRPRQPLRMGGRVENEHEVVERWLREESNHGDDHARTEDRVGGSRYREERPYGRTYEDARRRDRDYDRDARRKLSAPATLTRHGAPATPMPGMTAHGLAMTRCHSKSLATSQAKQDSGPTDKGVSLHQMATTSGGAPPPLPVLGGKRKRKGHRVEGAPPPMEVQAAAATPWTTARSKRYLRD
ncbi:hypothetical protein CJ030_MR0G007026 [Morella rubra]|uniref:Uncharacterized protein n=1 Tax=Morella rubra TaxID=262757 RepID=A0A6A1UJU2_9ROSI|nr:hypothetical protein CJ030_MR0G007026 [Morella rubra]